MRRRSTSGCLAGLVGAGLFVVAIVSVFGGGQSVKESPATPEYQAPTSAPDSPSATTKRPAGPKPTPTAGHLRFVDIGQARQVLPGLPVKGRAPLTDYSREAFGTAWSDTNDNGCDTRNDILRRDLRDTQVEDCVVMSGVLDDPYSGRTIGFTRGPVSSLDVQIDHVVALANAWQTGAAYWSPGKREQFANDRRNLLAVDGALNMQKSDGDAATWLPPRKSFRCAYVSMQVLAKQRYGLWVTAAEKAAMQRVLDRC